MSLSVAYDAENGWIIVHAQGQIRLPALKDFLPEVVNLSKVHNCFKVLVDFREATLALSVMEIYSLPQIVFTLLSAPKLPSYKFRRALVVKKITENLVFFENVSHNSGQTVKVFEDLELAKEWLQAP